MHRLDGGGFGIFFLKRLFLRLEVCWLPTAVVSGSILMFGSPTSALPLHSTLLEILQATRPFLLRTFYMSVPSACQCYSPNPVLETPTSPKGFVQLLLFPRCLPQPQAGPSPSLPLQAPAQPLITFIPLCCGPGSALGAGHIREHSCPSGAEV